MGRPAKPKVVATAEPAGPSKPTGLEGAKIDCEAPIVAPAVVSTLPPFSLDTKKESIMDQDKVEKARKLVKDVKALFSKIDKVKPEVVEQRLHAAVRPACSTGIKVLDNYVLGCGGLPSGRIVELYAEKGAGKTSIGYSCIAECQKAGGVAILIETEHAFDESRAKLFGVDTSNLVLDQPEHLEGSLKKVEKAIKHLKDVGVPVVIVFDSIAGFSTRAEMKEGLVGKDAGRERAKVLAPAIRVLTYMAAEYGASVLALNQPRTRMRAGSYMMETTTPGGEALHFHACARIQIFSSKSIKDSSGEHLGKYVKFFSMHNKLAPPFRKARVKIDYASGWDEIWTTINYAKELGVIGSRASYDAATLAQALIALEACKWVPTKGSVRVKVDDDDDEPETDPDPDGVFDEAE